MTGLGNRLKQARTDKGITLEDLQSITKIQKRYLFGIENEDYSMMPGSFYVRAFIKQYAEAVGLNPDEMLALYKDTSPNVSNEEESGHSASPTLTRRRSLASNSWLNEMMPKIIVALFIIVIIVVAWALYPKGDKSTKLGEDSSTEEPVTVENSTPDTSDTKPEKDEEEEEVEPEPETPEQTLAFEGASGETSTYELTGAESFKLEIRLNGGSWIGVKDNTGKEWLTPARIMTTGEKIEFDVSTTDSVRIRVGRPKSTEIYVNDELLEYGVQPADTVPQNIMIKYTKD